MTNMYVRGMEETHLEDEVQKVQGEVLYESRTLYQTICLFVEKDGAISLTLDKFWQFYSPEEAIYHEALMTVPMLVADRIDRVAILGGGDGLCVREALRFPETKEVHLAELDPEMIRMTREHPVMRSLTRDSLRDRRAHVAVGDARNFLARKPGSFDVIVCDFPDPTNKVLAELFSAGFYRRVAQRLAPGGVVSVQGSSPSSELDFAATYANLSRVFPHVAPYVAEMPTMGTAGMFVASMRPLAVRRPFPKGLRFLTEGRLRRMFEEGRKEGVLVLEKYRALVA